MALQKIDVNVSTDLTAFTGITSFSSPSFTTSKTNQLLLAFVTASDTAATSGGSSSGLGTQCSVSGAGLTWTLVLRQNSASTSGQKGCSEIWRAFSASILTAQTVAVAATAGFFTSSAMVTVLSFPGVDTSGTGGSGAIGATAGASAASGAPTVLLTTTRDDSFVFGVGNDWTAGTARTRTAGLFGDQKQQIVHEYTDATRAKDYWVQRLNVDIGGSGDTVTLSDSAPTADVWNLVAVEILQQPLSLSYTDISIVQTKAYGPRDATDAAGLSSLIFALDAPTTPGNVLLAFTKYSLSSATRSVTAPDSTWSKLDDVTTAADGLSVWIKRVTAAASSYTFPITTSGSNYLGSGVLFEISGVSQMPNSHSILVNGSVASASPTSITPTVIGALAIACSGLDEGATWAGVGPTMTSLTSGWTQGPHAVPQNGCTFTAIKNVLTSDTTTAITETMGFDITTPIITSLVLLAPDVVPGTPMTAGSLSAKFLFFDTGDYSPGL